MKKYFYLVLTIIVLFALCLTETAPTTSKNCSLTEQEQGQIYCQVIDGMNNN